MDLKSIQQCFKEQAEQIPNHTALVYQEAELTYDLLNRASNQLAHFILKQFKGRKTSDKHELLIALYMKPSFELVIGILGVLKAGCAYLPLYLGSPIQRINAIVTQTKSVLILTQSALLGDLELIKDVSLLPLDTVPYHLESEKNLSIEYREPSLAYVIFTSGSTGTPKGVRVSHQSVLNTLLAVNTRFNIGPGDKILAVSDISFDLSVYDILGMLIAGGTVIIPEYAHAKEPAYWQQLIHQYQISLWNSVPQLMQLLVDYQALINAPSTPLRVVLLSGDKIPLFLPEQIKQYNQQAIIMSLGGATEGSIWSIWYEVFAVLPDWDAIPYGFAMPNQAIYVLDKTLTPCPIGIKGEICIGGMGVALGYWLDTQKTKKSFIEHKQYGRIYKTGDLGVLNAKGYIEFHGRKDMQVKIRGYRIELAEIEHVLAKIPQIQQCTVVVHHQKTASREAMSLVAYYLSDKVLSESRLGTHMADYLPNYMLPDAFVRIHEFPLTANGKLDHSALPIPHWIFNPTTYQPPVDRFESLFCDIWQDLFDCPRVGVEDDFFRLGGDSISAILAAHKMSLVSKKTVTATNVFEYRTISQLVSKLRTCDELSTIEPSDSSSAVLSYAEERLLFVEQYEEGTDVYHIPITFLIGDSIQIDALEEAIQALIMRHSILRTCFARNSLGDLKPIIHSDPLDIHHLDINSKEWVTSVNRMIQQVFDLTREYPVRASICRITDTQELWLIFIIHHIAFDGWSEAIFIEELQGYYQRMVLGDYSPMPPLRIQYHDFAAWQRQNVSSRLHDLTSYWRDYLADYTPLAFPTDYTRATQVDYRGDCVDFQLPDELSRALTQLANSYDVTLYTMMLTGLLILLTNYTGQTDLLIGTPVANRQHPELENLIGFFVNTLALRFKLQLTEPLKCCVASIQSTVIEAQRNQDLPFDKLVDGLNIERQLSMHPLFQLMFVFEKRTKKERLISDLKRQSIPGHYKGSKFDLEIVVRSNQNKLEGSIQYATALFKKETILRLIQHYVNTLEAMVSREDAPISSYSILSQVDQKQLLYDWNHTVKSYPKEKTLHQLFVEQVRRTPNAIAVVFESQKMTYQALDEITNQLARYIMRQYPGGSVAPDTMICLCLARSLEMLIGILGILKAGAAYVPIDPTYPKERIRYVLEDTGSLLLLTQRHFSNELKLLVGSTGSLVTLDDKSYQLESKRPVTSKTNATHLAYVIYTSGTTGLPKGVAIEHTGIVNRLNWMQRAYPLHQDDVVLHKTPYSFDVSVWELLWAHQVGARLVIAKPEGHKDIIYLLNLIQEHRVTVMHFVPSMLSPFLEITRSFLGRIPPTLRDVFCSGEMLPVSTVKSCYEVSGSDFKLHNLYGPTEASIDVTFFDCEPSHDFVCIGKAIQNIQLYILNSELKPVPIGVIGELYIGGVGLAREYLNQPELTIKRFIANPFAAGRLYKTGDLVRWLADGTIDYIGRNDFQVKIKGFRIELGEIERVLAVYPKIKQVAVIAISEPHPRLVAYYVSMETISESELKKHLSTYLPDFMVPSVLIHLESLPLNANGKLDRKGLPKPVFEANQLYYVAPKTDLEIKLCEIWQSVLGVARIGILDDFFKLGGDSIQSIQVAAQLQKKHIACRVKDIFIHRCIQDLAFALSGAFETSAEQGVLSGAFDLLPIQSWFFDQHFPHPHYWNQAFMVRVPQLLPERLKEILPLLAKHHDCLSLRFVKDNGCFIRQVYDTSMGNFALKVLDVSLLNDANISDTLTEWQSGFNLETGPLWQVGYLTGYQDGSARLYFALHHLLVDVVSWRILYEDLRLLYEDSPLGLKSASYRQWVDIISRYPAEHPEELAYWQKTEQVNEHFVMPLLLKQPSVSVCHFDQSTTQQLLERANRAYHTDVLDLLLTALAYTLNHWLGGSLYVIGLESHGRGDIDDHTDVSHTVGWFTSLFPVQIAIKKNLSESIQHNKEIIHAIPNKGVGYGAFKQQQPAAIASVLPPIIFNYLGKLDQAVGSWQLSAESLGKIKHPENNQPHLLAIDGWVFNGRLEFYLSTYLSAEVAQEVARNFHEQLQNMMMHCISQYNARYTPCDFNTILMSRDLLDKLQQTYPNIEAIYPATSLQQGFIYHALQYPDDDAYRVQMLLDYNQFIEIDCYKRAWELAIETYPVLRMSFHWDETLIQIIHKSSQLTWILHDLRLIKDKQQAIQQIQAKDRAEAFDLHQPTLLRIHLIQCDEMHYQMLQSWHHAILDGWSISILMRQVHAYYVELCQDKVPEIHSESVYLKAQTYLAAHRALADKYWNLQMQSVTSINDLRVLFSDTKRLDKRRVVVSRQLQTQIIGDKLLALKQFIAREGLTLHVLMQFVWHKLIALYTRDQQTVVGTTVSGRTLPIIGIENSVGLYINTLPLVVDWNQGSIREQLNQIALKVNELNEFGFVDLATLQREGQRLFDSLLVFENFPFSLSEPVTEPKLVATVVRAIEKLDYPLGWIFSESDHALQVLLQYDADVLSKEKADKLLAQFLLILHQLPEKINLSHQAISVLSDIEYRQIVFEWNNNYKSYPKNKTLHQLFEDQVQLTPNNIAVVFDEQQLTYRQLNQVSNQLARFIRKHYQNESSNSLSPDTLIAVCVDRSLEVIIALLGILKAGAAYVPIDPSYPKSRIQFIVDDINASWVLTQSHYATLFKQCIELDNKPYQKEKTTDLSVATESNHLAYVIYTSGSTGTPKGVMVTHQNVVSLLTGIKKKYFDSEMGISTYSTTNYVFDIFGAEYGLPLLSGGTIELGTPNFSVLNCANYRFLQMTPSMWSTQIDRITHFSKTLLFITGEALTLSLFEILKRTGCTFINLYGPTEATIWATASAYLPESSKALSIGSALFNQQCYVLDAELSPVPIGAIGELYIGGDGLARGYLNQPALTKELFIPNPFVTAKHTGANTSRLYKTGDLVRYLADGTIEYRGRNDFQVKIRGFRIELGEIERVMASYFGIEQVVVISINEPHSQLIAYYVSRTILSESKLKTHLAMHLPDYMIPSFFIHLPRLPLTINGKVDRKSLPIPLFKHEQYVAPMNEVQQIMCQIWQDVLKVKKVGIRDDFFKLGGHSILAIQLSHAMSQRFHQQMTVKSIFEYRTIAALSMLSTETLKPIIRAKERLQLSYAQSRLWFIEQYEGGSHAYHIPILFRVLPDVDVPRLLLALQGVIARHAVLRSTINEDATILIHETLLPLPRVMLSVEGFAAHLEGFNRAPFDLASDYPIRAEWIEVQDGKSIQNMLAVTIHHIAFDAWSFSIFKETLCALYENQTLGPLPIQYQDYAMWQRGLSFETGLLYWKNQLSGIETLGLPTDYPRPKTFDYQGAQAVFELKRALCEKLKDLAAQEGVTVYSILLTVIGLTLSHYTNQTDLVIGTAIANRTHPEVSGLIGFFVNTLALRIRLQSKKSFIENLQSIQKRVIEAQLYQDVPFEQVVKALNVERDPSRHPLFQVMFHVEHRSEPSSSMIEAIPLDDGIAKFDLTFDFTIDSGIKGVISYATSLFKLETVLQIQAHMLHLLEEMTGANKKLHHYQMITNEEYQLLLYDWNKTYKQFPRDKTIPALFEAQAKRTPHQIALVYEERELSYQALNDASNQLARYIRKQYNDALSPDTLIAICLDRSLEMLIGLLAILKAGGAYVPIDPSYPEARIAYILEDTKAQLVLTETRYASRFERCIVLDETPYRAEKVTNLALSIQPSDLAYVIYTSGTTGQPKGVMINHTGIVNRLHWMQETYPLSHTDVVLHKTPYGFDVSVWELFWAHQVGARLVIAKAEGHRDSLYLYQLIDEQKITVCHFVPSMLSAFTQSLVASEANIPSSLRYVFCSGEALLECQVNAFYQLSISPIQVHNLYGPTEASVDSTSFYCPPNLENVLIGKPIQNTQVYVLDAHLNPLPMGAMGELYIGGVGLARGYLNQVELTESRFIINPFGEGRLYKTGDLVRWLSDGNLEYIGRNDFQVKIRGYRIELGEIEQSLSAFSGIQQSVVLAQERVTSSGKSQYLVGYYVSTEAFHEDDLRSYLAGSLPEYMVPSAFVYLPEFPLTINGKLDRKALPIPEFKSNEQSYLAPRTPLELKICVVWGEILGIERIGILDDFFRLGGDSIQSIQVSARLQRDGIDCRVRDLFTHRTIERLVLALGFVRQTKAEQGLLTGGFGLLPIQRWFLGLELACPQHWNQSFLVRVPELSLEGMSALLRKLSAHHDVLRARFQRGSDGLIEQVYGGEVEFEMPVLDVSTLAADDMALKLTAWQCDFNLEAGPLWRIGYVRGYADGSARLYFALHHLIVDGVSWRILIDDIKRLYENETLGSKGSSYRQWVEVISAYPEHHPEERSYWEEQLAIEVAPMDLSTRAYAGVARLDKASTQALLGVANRAYHTEINDLLLTALAYTLEEWLNDKRHVITLEGHGRESIDEQLDLSRTVGWFTSMFPVVLTTQSSMGESIQHIKETLHAIPNKGVGFGSFELDSRLPSITFNYLGQFDTASGYWQVVNEDSGESIDMRNMRPHLAALDGSVIDGVLQFSISTHVSEEACRLIVASFERHLNAVLMHCMSQSRTLYTPSDFNTVKLTRQLLDSLQERDVSIEAIYPANSLQQGFIYHALSQPDDDAYRVQLLFDYHQPIEVSAYRRAWELVIARYPTLRTYFNWDETPIQIIDTVGELCWTLHDIRKVADKAQAIEAIQQKDRAEAFDLQRPGLLRIHLIQQDEAHFTLLKSEHHSIGDGWSGPIVLHQVHIYYAALCAGQTLVVSVDTAYVRTQRYIYEHRLQAMRYWDKQLETLEAANDLNALLSDTTPLDAIRVIEDSRESMIQLEADDYQRLKQLMNAEGLTLNVLVQFAWHKLIQVYTQDTQTIVGTTVSGRALPVAGIENSVGPYINTLPLIIDWSESRSSRAQLRLIEERLIEMNEYSFADLASLQREGRRLFHSLFIFENYPISELNATDDIALKVTFRASIEKLDYPLGLIAYEADGALHLVLKYAGTYLTQMKAQRLLSQMHLILSQLPQKLNEPQDAICLLTAAEYQQIVYEWNKTSKAYPKDKTIHQLFEAQAKRTPHQIALVYGERKLTYRELNQAANQLAHFILKQYQHNLPAGTLIAICIERSPEMIIGMLGILKAGAAYVPIDPNHPAARIGLILAETQAQWVITQTSLAHQFQQCITLDNPSDWDVSSTNLPAYSQATDLAYVIFTSGSTGKPKGVSVCHTSVINTICAVNERFHLDETDSVLALSEYHFDLSVYDIFGLLFVGGRVILPNQAESKVPAHWHELIAKHQVSIWNSVPQLMQLLLESRIATNQKLHSFKAVLLSGDLIPINLPKQIKHHYDVKSLMSLGGATEGSIWSIWYEIRDMESQWLSIPYGRAMPNQAIYVLDDLLRPCPIGVRGEICIGGDGVALGYWHNDKMTTKHFVEDSDFGRLYKTGDLGYWDRAGYVVFYGRKDTQIKIRGYRIELGEIEYLLSIFAGIQQSAVLAHERVTSSGKSQYLVGYYVSTDAISEVHLRAHLVSHLPEYMIPSVFVHLLEFPLTTNGKLDRKALPEPEWVSDVAKYIAPRDELEMMICRIWQEGLDVPRVGITDDFFGLGGHSILAIQVSHRMSQVMKRMVGVADLLNHRTISALSTLLRTGEALLEIPATGGQVAPLSFAQERLWFIEQYEGGTDAYHIPMIFALSADVSIDALKRALEVIVSRHAILRTVFRRNDSGEYVQQIEDRALEIVEFAVDASDFDARLAEAAYRVFDLTRDYPMRAWICRRLDTNVQYLMITIHHVAFDEWSGRVFMNEFLACYEALKGGTPLSLPELPIQYKDFAVWQRDYLSSRLESLMVYWKTKLSEHEPLAMPLDYARPAQMDYRGDLVYFEFTESVSAGLHGLADSRGLTLYTVLLSGFALLLSRYSGQTDLLIGTPVANRQHPQLAGLIGFFVNTLVLRIQLAPDASLAENMEAIQSDLMDAQWHQDLPFEKLVDGLKLERDSSRHPLFQVLFTVEYADDLTEEASDVTPASLDNQYQPAKFDLTLTISASKHKISGGIHYATSLFKRDTIERLSTHYQQLVERMCERINAPISSYPILTPAEYQQVLYDWNKTSKVYPKNKTILQLFEAQAKRTPHQIALVYEERGLSYQALNDASNQLARYIRKQYNNALSPDTLIAIFLDRSLEMLIGLLGILKAGGAYVPIDPSYPEARIAYILEDTKAQLVLTETRYASRFERCIVLDETSYRAEKATNLALSIQPSDLAYVIYTSGTTGQPKGVMISHANVTNYYYNVSVYLNDINQVDFSTSLAFDLTVTTTLAALMHGKTICIYAGQLQDIDDYAHHLRSRGIDFVKLTPSYLSQLSSLMGEARIKRCFLGGEKLELGHLRQIGRYIDEIYDEYGPTETTVGISLILKNERMPVVSSIGKPYHNDTVYVLDQQTQLVPIGVMGELYIGGAGLARGYLNQPELTKERFISNPFASEADKAEGYTRLYKTGDLVRWLPDGNLEYIGRNDFQVKIRGYRIELNEIEHVLSAYANIQQSVVVVHQKETDSGVHQQLVGYYVSDASIDEIELQTYLTKCLPDYMVPSALIHMGAFPLTINGKLDRKALPIPEFKSKQTYLAPRTPIEVKLSEVWGEVLGIDRVGVLDDFFKLGGHSILAMKLIAQINRELSSNLAVSDLFRYKSIINLINGGLKSKRHDSIIKVLHDLDKSKNNLYFIHAGFGGSEVYQAISDTLIDQYNSFGIDSYYFNSEIKVTSLSFLANYYLEHMKPYISESKPVVLFGWSLGGSIALEMAYQLEKEGIDNITVYLLDTFLPDEYHKKQMRCLSLADYKQEKQMEIKQLGYDDYFVNAAVNACDSVYKLMQESVSGRLCHTSVVLFKATQIPLQPSPSEKTNDIIRYNVSLRDNNIQKAVKKAIKIINLDCNHEDIIQSKTISAYLLDSYDFTCK